MKVQKVCLVIICGFGYPRRIRKNAASFRRAPVLSRLFKKYCSFLLASHGEKVGLLEGMVGSSESGHMTIGAGRPVPHSITLVNRKISNGEFRKVLYSSGIVYAHKVHVVVLLSDAYTESRIAHAKAIIKEFRSKGGCVFVHCIVGKLNSSSDSFDSIFKRMKETFTAVGAVIASISGGHFSMSSSICDDYIRMAYDTMLGKTGVGEMSVFSSVKVELIEPALINPDGSISESSGEVVIFSDFDPKGMRRLASLISKVARVFTMTEYGVGGTFPIIRNKKVRNTLAEIVSRSGATQTHVAETSRYTEITSVMNGRRGATLKNERWIAILSPGEHNPSGVPIAGMENVCVGVCEEMRRGVDFIACNLAALDVISHTGNYKATISAVSATDEIVKKIVKCGEKNDYIVVITSDHGEASRIIGGEGNAVKIKHRAIRVPLIIYGRDYKRRKMKGRPNYSGRSLVDVAPTVLKLMGLEKHKDMSGESLI